ncbi:MAG: caspase family protein, partial [Bacteroidota bacterium]
LLFLWIGLKAQKPKLVVPQGHSSYINAVSFSPDGQLILTSGGEGTAKVWTKDGRLLTTIKQHKASISVAQFSPDGQSFLTVSDEPTAYLWSTDGQLLGSFQESDAHFVTAAIAPNGQYIVSANDALEIKIWDLSGRVLQTFSGHESWVTEVDFSPDSKQIITGSQDRTFKLWDTSGRLIKTVNAHDDYLTAARFSPDGQQILTSSGDKTIKLWTLDGQLLKTFDHHQVEVGDAVFSPDGQQILSTSEEGKPVLFDLNGRILREFSDDDNELVTLAFSPDGQYILTGGFVGMVTVWNKNGQVVTTLKGEADHISSIKLTPNGQHLLVNTGEGKVKLWDLKNQLLKNLKTAIDTVGSIAFSPDGQQILLGGNYDDGQLELMDLQGQSQQRFAAHDYTINEVHFSPDGQRFASVSWDRTVKVWNLAGQLMHTLKDGEKELSSIAFSPDGETLLTGTSDGNGILWNNQGQAIRRIAQTGIMQVKSVDFSYDGQSMLLAGTNDDHAIALANKRGQILQTFDGDRDIVEAAEFSPNGALIASGGWDLSAKIWDRKGQLLQKLDGHTDRITSLTFSSDGQILWTGSYDNTIRLWSIQTGEALATLVVLNEEDWIVSTPNGLFDASPRAMGLLYYVVGYEGKLEVIELEQLKARYYEPGLLAKILDFSEERIRPVEEFEEVELYPEIQAEINDGILQVQLNERNGGSGGISVFINGKEVLAPSEAEGSSTKPQNSARVDLGQYQNLMYRHPDSTNVIKVRAYNADGWLKSPAVELPYKLVAGNAKGRRTTKTTTPALLNAELDPKLYVLSIGTSNYTGTKLDLKYADQDATVMAQAMQAVSSNLFSGGAGVEVFCFSTASPDSTGLEGTPIKWQFSNKKNIEQTFKEIKTKAKAEDVLMVYLSGHGITYGNARKSQFHYLTQGIADDDLSDRAIRRAFTISSDELTKWINDIPALKQVLIIDACNSGQVVENLTSSTKNLNTSQIRALDRMKDRTGMFILSGSASDKVSYEASEYGQGLLTYALLQGMLGIAARKTADGEYVDVMKLFQYARDEVPRLAASINGIQTPMLGFPTQGASFDLGVLDDRVKAKIPVGNKKPVFVRSIFLNEDTFDDDQDLVGALQSALQKETIKGKNADLIYIDVNSYPQAYAVRGFYKMNQENIELRAKLLYGDERIDLAVRPTDDPKRLMKYLMRSLKRALKK